MSVFTRFAIRSLKRNCTRTAVSIIGIALSCALITAVFTSVVSMTTMLRERTAADEGTWQVEAIGLNEEGLETIAADGRIDRHIEVVELGSVSMGEENAKSYGPYQFIKTWPQNPDGDKIVTMQKITDGHAPQAAGEVVLPHYLQGVTLQPCGITAEGALDIGSHLSLQLGTRTITTSDGTYVSLSSSNIGGTDEEITDSYEANLGTLDLTVVGFYYAYGLRSTSAMEGTCFFVYPESGCVEKAATDGAEATCVYSLITVHNSHDADPLAQELANSSQATGGASTHNSLLRWQGATNDADIWTTLYMMAGILAAVIIVALVQLIQRHPAFLRNFQIAGVIAIAGNLVVFLLMEAVHVYYTTNPGALGDGTAYGYSWQAGTHWTFVVLALMWTIFWTLYFARSVRMRHYMSPDNPYTTANGLPYMERALFGRGMRG